MAKNKNGQTVKNKKYYKNKNTGNSKKKTNKNKGKKLENNVSIIVDEKKEALNYNIVEEEKVDVPREEEFDYRTKKAKLDRKVKTNFNDDKAEEKFEDKFLFSEAKEDKKSKNKKKKSKRKSKKEEIELDLDFETKEPKKEEIELDLDFETKEPKKEEIELDLDFETKDSKKEEIELDLDFDSYKDEVEDVELKASKEKHAKEKAEKDKDLVDKAFEDNDKDIGDIDKPAIFRNISPDDGSFRRFIIKLFVLLIILILSIFFVIDFSAKYMNTTTTKDVGYFESSDIDYSLCNGGKCTNTNLINKYINTINVKFEYDLSFDEKINFDGKYNIIAKFSINDDKTGDVLYTENKEIKKDTFNEKNIQEFEIKDDAIVLLDDYRKFVSKYNKDRKSNYTGEVRVNLYVDGVNGKKRVSSLLIPLQERRELEKTVIAYQAGDASIEDDGTHYGKVYVYLIIISLVLVVASSIGVVLLLSGAEEEEEE